jgi:hypothetical protein
MRSDGRRVTDPSLLVSLRGLTVRESHRLAREAEPQADDSPQAPCRRRRHPHTAETHGVRAPFPLFVRLYRNTVCSDASEETASRRLGANRGRSAPYAKCEKFRLARVLARLSPH